MPPRTRPQKFCTKCGNSLSGDAVFCRNCGTLATDADKIAAVKANTKTNVSTYRNLNREAYERQASELKKRYPNECIGFLDGKLVAHDRDYGEMIKKFSRLGVEGNTLSIFHTGANDAPTAGLEELCPNCNAPLAPPPAIFCGDCGYLSRCTKCMSLRPLGAEFCGKCGPTLSDTRRSDEEKAKAKCPRCESTEVIRIIYGLPANREEAMKAEREGKIKLGGCLVGEESPNFTCKSCGKEWLTLYLETKLASQEVLATSVHSLKQLGYVTSIHGNEIQAIKTRRILNPHGGAIMVTIEHDGVSINYEGRKAFTDAKDLLETLKQSSRKQIRREALRDLLEQERTNLEIATHDRKVLERNLVALKVGQCLQTSLKPFQNSAPVPRLYDTIVDSHSTNLGVMNLHFKSREDLSNDKSLAKLGDFRSILHDTDEKLLERLKLLTDEINSVIQTCEETVRSDTVP